MEIKLEPCGRAEAELIRAQLSQYNSAFIIDWQELNFCLRNADGELLGGIVAQRELDCLMIDFLFVAPELRGRGWGSALLRQAEQAAASQGARRAVVNTFSFQAPGFYPAQGYRPAAAIEPCLGKYSQYFYVKELTPGLSPEPHHQTTTRGDIR